MVAADVVLEMLAWDAAAEDSDSRSGTGVGSDSTWSLAQAFAETSCSSAEVEEFASAVVYSPFVLIGCLGCDQAYLDIVAHRKSRALLNTALKIRGSSAPLFVTQNDY